MGVFTFQKGLITLILLLSLQTTHDDERRCDLQITIHDMKELDETNTRAVLLLSKVKCVRRLSTGCGGTTVLML